IDITLYTSKKGGGFKEKCAKGACAIFLDDTKLFADDRDKRRKRKSIMIDKPLSDSALSFNDFPYTQMIHAEVSYFEDHIESELLIQIMEFQPIEVHEEIEKFNKISILDEEEYWEAKLQMTINAICQLVKLLCHVFCANTCALYPSYLRVATA
nr:hypothetical protein [Tanacetum cinerariifolium]